VEKEIDVRGMPCPQPVLRTRKAMGEADRLVVLITDEDQVGNVVRMAERNGWHADSEPVEDHFKIVMTRDDAVRDKTVESESAVDAPVEQDRGSIVVLASDRMGSGADPLGFLLMKAFISTLKDVERRPATMIFYNTGVKLTVAESPCLEDLLALQSAGVEMLVCGTCLEYFELREFIRAGVVSNMYDIASRLTSGSCIVRI
jgi:selenium metabolism protein YedF